MERKPTKGEIRVGVTFNTTNPSEATIIKEVAADLINIIEQFADRNPRLVALAQTAIEEGSMWAVRAATEIPVEK